MKWYLPTILIFVSIFTACEKADLSEDNPPKDDEEIDEEKLPSTFLSIAEAQRYVFEHGDTTALIHGFIVGSTITSIKNAAFEGEEQHASNLLLADSALITSYSSCFPIILSKSSTSDRKIRNELNLVDHPDYFGKSLYVYGWITHYYRVPGIKKIYFYKWGNEKDTTNRKSIISFPFLEKEKSILLIGR